jgi:hypothetical protein
MNANSMKIGNSIKNIVYDEPDPEEASEDEGTPSASSSKLINEDAGKKCWSLYKLTERAIGKSGVTMTLELVAHLAIMVIVFLIFTNQAY